MANIFISHSTIDSKLANFLCESFESKGLSCWIAPRNITPGEDWATSITNAILSADIFFILYSENSLKSAQCAREIAIADRKKKYILPYKIDDSEPEGAFDYYLTGCQWVIVNPASGDYKIDELCELMSGFIRQNSTGTHTQALEAIQALEDMTRNAEVASKPVVRTPQVSQPSEHVAREPQVSQPNKPIARTQQVAQPDISLVNMQRTVNNTERKVPAQPVTKTNDKVKTASKTGNKSRAQKERRNFMIISIGLLLLICVVVALLIGAVILRNNDSAADSKEGIFQGVFNTSEKDFMYEVTDGGIIITGYTGDDADISIPSKIEGNTVVGIAEKAFYQCNTISSVKLPDTIKEIPAYAFYKCTNLSEIVIPNGVTYIGSHAFEGCISLTTIDLPKSVNIVGDFAFNACSNLSTVNMPGVQSIGMYAFATCSSLDNVTLPDSLRTIGDMSFAYCVGMGYITIPDQVESVSVNTFMGCNNLSLTYRGETYTNDISELFGN